MDMERYTKLPILDLQLQLSKNSPKKTLKQFRNWLDNEMRSGKGKNRNKRR